MRAAIYRRYPSEGVRLPGFSPHPPNLAFEIPEVNGRIGPKTAAAVKALQKQAGLTVDGNVGPQTCAVVDALESEGPSEGRSD